MIFHIPRFIWIRFINFCFVIFYFIFSFVNLAPLVAPISDEIKKLPPFNPINSFPERERHPPLKPT